MATKEVYFVQYCKDCVHFEKKEDESPCDECLTEAVREDSHKPEYFKEKDK